MSFVYDFLIRACFCDVMEVCTGYVGCEVLECKAFLKMGVFVLRCTCIDLEGLGVIGSVVICATGVL